MSSSGYKYCFIIPRTPVSHRTPERERLWSLALKSLFIQTSQDWQAIIIGPVEKELEDDKRFLFIEHDLLDKRKKVVEAVRFIIEHQLNFDYLIRFDDDDLINRNILHDISLQSMNFNCIVDRFHAFLESDYKLVSLQEREWFPNTCAHAFDDAVQVVKYGDEENFLIAHDHSVSWHKYYKEKAVQYTDKQSPFYLRVISKTSITSNLKKSYFDYLSSFGDWNFNMDDFKQFNEIRDNDNKNKSVMKKTAFRYMIAVRRLKNRIAGKLVSG